MRLHRLIAVGPVAAAGRLLAMPGNGRVWKTGELLRRKRGLHFLTDAAKSGDAHAAADLAVALLVGIRQALAVPAGRCLGRSRIGWLPARAARLCASHARQAAAAGIATGVLSLAELAVLLRGSPQERDAHLPENGGDDLQLLATDTGQGARQLLAPIIANNCQQSIIAGNQQLPIYCQQSIIANLLLIMAASNQ